MTVQPSDYATTYPRHLRVTLDPSDACHVETPAGALPWDEWDASLGAQVRVLDLNLEHLATPEQGTVCRCGRARAVSQHYMVLAAVLTDIHLVRRWTPHSCALPVKTPRVANLDCTDLAGSEGDEFTIDATRQQSPPETATFAGVWEYDEFPRFILDRPLPRNVVIRVMMPGDDDEEDDEGDGEQGEDDEEEGDWEDEDEEEQDDERGEEHAAGDLPDAFSRLAADPATMARFMATTKYPVFVSLLLHGAGGGSTRFTLVDVASWEEDEPKAESKIRAELAKALAKPEHSKLPPLDDVVRFVSLDEYRAEVGDETFKLEAQNTSPWAPTEEDSDE